MTSSQSMEPNFDIEIDVASYEDKVRAVLKCLMTGRGFSIRELRKCANRNFAVSEKTVSKILKELHRMGVVVNMSKRWFLFDYDFADRFVRGGKIREESEIRFLPSFTLKH
jgi:hypothetical protein